MYKLVIFDLDGTLIDSVNDLAIATNRALAACGYPVHPTDAYRHFVGNGINKLLERALPEGYKSPENISEVRKLFLPYYTSHGTEHTAPYTGIVPMLMGLQLLGVRLAIASNKYHVITEQMVPHFFPTINFETVIGQRDNIPPKPDPAIVEDIHQRTKVAKSDTLYVGDTVIDIETARNAGLDMAAVTWGFRPKAELKAYSPKYLIDSPKGIISLFL
ncbi:MAG: HAD family hydrolase [Prevotellaceae bacterium]|jgi:phosphoglycolate phosphatase|nr:HAD family hydrolase [Prevotellaceae bacterium]